MNNMRSASAINPVALHTEATVYQHLHDSGEKLGHEGEQSTCM